MTISSPITLTVNSVAKVLPRVNQDNFGSVYRLKETDDEWELNIRHTYEGKAGPAQIERHNADFKHTKYVGTDRIPVVTQAYFIMRNPRNQSGVDCTQVTQALMVWGNTVAADLSAGQN
jgi:hypothetical protein